MTISSDSDEKLLANAIKRLEVQIDANRQLASKSDLREFKVELDDRAKTMAIELQHLRGISAQLGGNT